MAGLLVKYRSKQSAYVPAADENGHLLSLIGAPGTSTGGELHVIGTIALLRLLPGVPTDRERFLSLLRSRSLLTHADAINALWGEGANGGPLYAQNILAIYVSRLRRAGHLIENYRGIGYRIRDSASGVAAE
jgi:hypothetical protein